MIPVVAYLAEQYVRNRLLDGSTGFNGLIQQTAITYSVRPFQLSTTTIPANLFLGRYSVADIQKAMNVGSTGNYPCAVLSIAKADSMGRVNMRVTPSEFSGQVIVSLDFYVSHVGNLPPDGNSVFFAVGDALTSALNSKASYSSVPQGLVYNNELLIEQGRMEWDGVRWIQIIPCAVMFSVVA